LIRPSELELHARAQKLFEHENPGRFWRTPASFPIAPSYSERIAGLIERQAYLARVREQMRAEGVQTIPD
jgi:predicted AAA+ superfamily ATPase